MDNATKAAELAEQAEALSPLLRHPKVAVKAIADAGGRTLSRAYMRIRGEETLGVIELRKWLKVIAEADRETAIEILSDLFDLSALGLEVRPSATSVGRESVATDFLQAAVHVGRAAEKLAAAGDDVDAIEAAGMLPDVRHAKAEYTEAEAKLEAIAARSTQLSLATH